MAQSLSREFLLAAACSVWPPSERRSESIRALADGVLDWDHFLQMVRRHRVAGLVHDGLTRALPAVPADIAREIAAEARALVRHNLAYAAEAVRLRRLFTDAHLPVVFIKGVSLAVLAYGNLGLRHSRDVDLLVPAEAIAKASAILGRAGYRRLQPPPSFSEAQLRVWMLRCKEIWYVHDDKQLELELHSRLFDNPRLMSDIVVSGPLRTVSVAKGIGLPTFGEEDLFAYLCAHGAVHDWFRLKWLADIGALLAQQPKGGVERLYLAAEARGAGPSAAQAMLLCRRLLGTMIPEPLVATLRRKPAVRWLETIAIKAMTADRIPTDLPFGTTWSSLARFLLGRDWRYWLAEIKVYATSPVDILMLPLPERLQLLYPVLRLPLWIWRHSIHRGRSPN
jgi:Uncharacterised nucleotidyltransferase